MNRILLLSVLTLSSFLIACEEEEQPNPNTLFSVSLCTGEGQIAFDQNVTLTFFSNAQDASLRQNQVLVLSASVGDELDLSSLQIGQDYWVYAVNDNGRSNWYTLLQGSSLYTHSEGGIIQISALSAAEENYVSQYEVFQLLVNEENLLGNEAFECFTDDRLEITVSGNLVRSPGALVCSEEDLEKTFTWPYTFACFQVDFVDQGLGPEKSSIFDDDEDLEELRWEDGKLTLRYFDSENGQYISVIYRKVN